jgi:hypothetical protein
MKQAEKLWEANMKHASSLITVGTTFLLTLLCVFTGGCAHYPETPPLEQVGTGGYRLAKFSWLRPIYIYSFQHLPVTLS